MKKNLIKKVSVLAVCAAMAFGVAACGGSTEEGGSAFQLNPPTDDLAEAAAAGVSVGDYSNHHEIYNVYLSKDNEYESELEASRTVYRAHH